MKPRVLVIDDDNAVLQSCEAILDDAGYEVHLAPRPEDGLALLRRYPFDLALVDFKLPGMNGFEVLERASAIDPEVVLVMFTAYATLDSAVDAVKRGAFHYIAKPFTASQLLAVAAKGLEHSRVMRQTLPLSQQLEQCCPLHHIVGRSEAIEQVLSAVAKVAPSDANLLITGPSGTGKKLIARALGCGHSRPSAGFSRQESSGPPPVESAGPRRG
jgi:DNA-binding NtrC family response regulator